MGRNKNNMKRIGVFVFYDLDGIVDDFKLYLLESLKDYISHFIIVVNGKIQEDSFDRLHVFSDHIFIRKNIGYDAGAYKDILTGKYEYIDWQHWDEIILFNDTFYGPLFTWKNIFSVMESDDYDFWGLSRYTGGSGVLPDGMQTPEHIQGYFLAISRKMFTSPYWTEFWQELDYPATYLEAIEKFEIYFTLYFNSKGFTYSTWLDKNGGARYIEEGSNPYLKYPYEIIKHANFPVIKWRLFSVIRYRSSCATLQFVENHTNYNKNLILQHLERMNKLNCIRPFNESELKNFISLHNKIYIFGHGEYGKGLQEFFHIKGWKFNGFVVSAPTNSNEIGLQDLILEKGDGMIVALNMRYENELKKNLEERFNREQLLFSTG